MFADTNEPGLLHRDERFAQSLTRCAWVIGAGLALLSAWLFWQQIAVYASVTLGFALAISLSGRRWQDVYPPLFVLLLLLVAYVCVAGVVLGEASASALLLLPAMLALLLAPGVAQSNRWWTLAGLLALASFMPVLVGDSTAVLADLAPARWLHAALAVLASLIVVQAASEQMSADEQSLDHLQQQSELLTQSDRLTGLHNRGHLEEQLTAEMARSRRSEEPVTVALVDVDRMGEINAEHGHACGDAVLRVAALTLKRTLREYDQIGRWEGQRFLLIMPRTSLLAACSVCQRLVALVENASRVQGEIVPPFTASFGLAACSPDEDPEHAIHQARKALTLVISEGGNGVARFESGAAHLCVQLMA